MASHISVALALLAGLASAQKEVHTISGTPYTITQDLGGDIPLASKVFDYPYLPYQADTGNGPRGRMQGYNLCNSTTAGEDSLCTTAFVNSIDDFCIWGSATPNEVVGDIEGEMVAYCTTDKYGTRVLPAGALQGIQFTKTPGYVQVVGMIDQSALNLVRNDTGGEEDPHGADQRGNPLGSLMYSNAFGKGPSSDFQQVVEWSYFVGSGTFCMKACDPAGPNAAQLCQHIYDRIGCAYNAPADYASINGTFQTCQGDNQLPAGVYVEDGKTMTYQQPPESLGPITSIPYVAAVPASSECSTLSSAAIYTGLSSASSAGPTSAPTSGAAQSNSAANAAASSSSADQSSFGARNIASAAFVSLFAIFGALCVV